MNALLGRCNQCFLPLQTLYLPCAERQQNDERYGGCNHYTPGKAA